MQFSPLVTPRFTLRPLRAADVSDRYSRWFDDPAVAPHILAARSAHDIESLRRYVAERSDRDDVLFLGIFTQPENAHIGNVKYEPVNSRQGVAVMGILIGDPAWRGKGVAEEVIVASAGWLQAKRGIRKIVLGVDKNHPAAIAAYEKIGFRIDPDAGCADNGNAFRMTWHLDQIKGH